MVAVLKNLSSLTEDRKIVKPVRGHYLRLPFLVTLSLYLCFCSKFDKMTFRYIATNRSA